MYIFHELRIYFYVITIWSKIGEFYLLEIEHSETIFYHYRFEIPLKLLVASYSFDPTSDQYFPPTDSNETFPVTEPPLSPQQLA